LKLVGLTLLIVSQNHLAAILRDARRGAPGVSMIARVFAWIAVIFGGVITAESTLVAHRPNLVWAIILLAGIAYFAKNGFLGQKPQKLQ
jgi:hypothetical protein